MIPTGWIAAGAVLALLVGLVMILGGWNMRHRRGLGEGRTISLDDVTLTSHCYGLKDKKDRRCCRIPVLVRSPV